MNILLVSHGELCQGALNAYHMFSSDAPNVSACSLTDDGVEDFRARLTARVEELLAEGPLLIMADLKGGTPYNESYALFLQHPESIRIASGFNFPMLLETGVVAADCDDLDSVYETALSAGSFGIQGTDLPMTESADENEDLF